MKTKIYLILKVLAGCLLIAAFFSPFPIPYLYKLDRQLVGEGTFISHHAYYGDRPDLSNRTLVYEFRYFNQMHGREEVLDMSGEDNSQLWTKDLQSGQHVYVYALGPLKWTAATTVKNDLRGVFFIRAMVEFAVRSLFFVLVFFLLCISFGSGEIAGGGLSPSSILLLYGGTRL